MKTKNKAFTLAETLVVMGIIGVIAALTIPNLSQSTGNKERITKVQKAYSNLVEAIDRATAIYGPYSTWPLSTDSHNVAGNRITEFMKLSKNCKTDPTCTTSTINHPYYHFTLADGTNINFYCDAGVVAFNLHLFKYGEKWISGKTAFRGTFMNNSDNFKLLGIDKDFDYLKSAVTKCNHPSGEAEDNSMGRPFNYCEDGALIWIIRYGNMDYLKFTSEGKCPNGNEPTESNPRCN